MRAGVAGLQAVLGQRGMSAGVLKAAGSPPINVAQPLIDDSIPGVGETIYSTNGTWTGATSFAYQWFQNSLLPISGATNSSYTLQSSDIGFAVYCQVTASNASGSTSTNSGAVNAVTATPVCQQKLNSNEISGSIGDSVSTRPDTSGNGNPATQVVMVNQGTLQAGLNGNKAVQLNGVADYYNIATPFYPGTDWAHFFVARKLVAAGSGGMLMSLSNFSSPSGNPTAFVEFTDGNVYVTNQIQVNFGTDDSTDWNTWLVINKENVLSLFKNGVPLSIPSSASDIVATLWDVIGGRTQSSIFSGSLDSWSSVFTGVPTNAVLNNNGQFLTQFSGKTWTPLT